MAQHHPQQSSSYTRDKTSWPSLTYTRNNIPTNCSVWYTTHTSLPLPVTAKNDTDPDTIPDIVSCFEMADAKHTTVPISPSAQLSKTTAIPLDTASLP